jgi:hypothetical protein
MDTIRAAVRRKLEHLRKKGIGHRFLYLLISLILLIVLEPQVASSGAGSGLLLTLVLVSGIYAMSDDRRQLIVSIILAVPVLIAGWAFLVFVSPTFEIGKIVFAIAFYTFLTTRILSYVIRTERVTRETIFGAICVYLLIGITWATGYLFLQATNPGAFFINPDMQDQNAVFLYYSFVTLTTTGFGDIVPLTATARTLSMFETVTGVLFTAVLVARLVGSLSPGERDEEN